MKKGFSKAKRMPRVIVDEFVSLRQLVEFARKVGAAYMVKEALAERRVEVFCVKFPWIKADAAIFSKSALRLRLKRSNFE